MKKMEAFRNKYEEFLVFKQNYGFLTVNFHLKIIQ